MYFCNVFIEKEFMRNQLVKIHHYLPYLAVLVSMLLWGTSTIFTKNALESFPPVMLITLRFSIALVLMLIIGLLSGQLQRLEKRDIPMFVLAGFIQPFGYYVFETYGLQMMSSPTLAEVILSTIPLFAPVFAWLILRERVTIYNIIGIVLSMIGVLMMILVGGTTFSSSSPWGYVLLGGAVVSSIFYSIMLRKVPAHYNNWSVTFYIFLFGTLFMCPVFFVVDYPHLSDYTMSLNGWLSIGYLAVVCTIICYILFCYCVRKIGVTRSNVFNNVRPVFTALYMLLFFGEQMPLVKWVGIFIVVAGLFVSQYRTRR